MRSSRSSLWPTGPGMRSAGSRRGPGLRAWSGMRPTGSGRAGGSAPWSARSGWTSRSAGSRWTSRSSWALSECFHSRFHSRSWSARFRRARSWSGRWRTWSRSARWARSRSARWTRSRSARWARSRSSRRRAWSGSGRLGRARSGASELRCGLNSLQDAAGDRFADGGGNAADHGFILRFVPGRCGAAELGVLQDAGEQLAFACAEQAFVLPQRAGKCFYDSAGFDCRGHRQSSYA